MSSKNQAEVLIDGRIYRLSGYESEEYLLRVASYLNNKIGEVKKAEGYHRLSPEYRAVMLDLNVVDDYFKTRKKADELGEQISQKDKEIYDVKHDLVTAQIQLETAEKTIAALRDEVNEYQKKNVQLEARLEQRGSGSGRS